MSQNRCIRCGHTFDRKSRLLSHYNRENICKPIELNVPITVLKEVINEQDDNVLKQVLRSMDENLYYKYIGKQIEHRNVYIHTQNSQTVSNLSCIYTKDESSSPDSGLNNRTKETDRLTCKYCNKYFKSYVSRLRHENHYCQDKEIYVTPKSESKDSSVENLELDRDELIETIMKDESILKEIIQRISNISKKDINNIINNSNSYNTTNNTTHNTNSHNTTNNTHNNTTVNIQQNTFGNEKFDYIVNDKRIEAHLEKLADTDTRRFFIELFRIAFFSNKHPENKTFALDNAKSLYIKILKELPDKWIYASKSDTIYKKILQILSFITDHTNIVTEGTETEKTIEDVREDRNPAISDIKKEFEMMEILHYKNKKLEDSAKAARLLNRKPKSIIIGDNE